MKEGLVCYGQISKDKLVDWSGRRRLLGDSVTGETPQEWAAPRKASACNGNQRCIRSHVMLRALLQFTLNGMYFYKKQLVKLILLNQIL